MNGEVALSKEDFVKIRDEEQGVTPPRSYGDADKQERQDAINAMSTRAFLIGRTKETIKVPVAGLGGTKDIEIRTRLSKSELQINSIFLHMFTEATKINPGAIELLDSEYGDEITAEFMAMISVDPELDATFWMPDNIDPGTIQDVLIVYFSKQMRT